MRAEQIRHRLWLSATGMLVLSLVAAVADRAAVLDAFRPVLHDALSPGRLALLAVKSPVANDEAEVTAEATPENFHDSRQKTERLLRQFMIENARLRRDLKRERASSVTGQNIGPLSSLAQFELVNASIVSSSGMPSTLKEVLVDAGKSAGITRSELVIDGKGAIVDAGLEKDVAAGDRVLTGAVVVGRIERSARWVSLVQPVTSPEFRAQVTVMRQAPDGLYSGTVAMLEGTGGNHCILTGIPHTEAVAVGDEVITADINGVRGPHLYFGRVTHAEFLAGGQWDVRVQPAANLQELDHVGILRLKLARPATSH
ncbi:MAG: rod shape-determining protein MreC [Planctomycetota bacterium]